MTTFGVAHPLMNGPPDVHYQRKLRDRITHRLRAPAGEARLCSPFEHFWPIMTHFVSPESREANAVDPPKASPASHSAAACCFVAIGIAGSDVD